MKGSQTHTAWNVARSGRAFSGRQLVYTYTCALSMSAFISIASYWTLAQVLRVNDSAAAVINLSGRQRMYSQRIASLTAQYALGNRTVRSSLLDTIGRLETAHRHLAFGDAGLHLLPAASDPALRQIYFGGSHPLDRSVADFVTRARRITAMSPADPTFSAAAAPIFALAQTQLLDDLDRVVTVHQHESEQTVSLLNRLEVAMLVIFLVTLVAEAFAIFQPMVRRITCYARELMNLATTDPLTGLLNRRSFYERASVEMQKAKRYSRPLSMLIVDADHFKAVNDRFGHDGGDAVLKTLASTLADGIRGIDLLARIGGEEFAILLPETDIHASSALAERIRDRVAALDIRSGELTITITVSIGVAWVEANESDLTQAFKRADSALYVAKKQGRNRVVTASATLLATLDPQPTQSA